MDIRLSSREKTLREIRESIAQGEDQITTSLDTVWDLQRTLFTGDVIREMVNNRELPESVLEAWEDSYTRWVAADLYPRWDEAAVFAGSSLEAELLRLEVEVPFSEFRTLVGDFLDARGGSLIVNLSSLQKSAINAALRRYIVDEPKTPEELMRILEPMVGLTPRDAQAVANLRARDEEEGLSGLVIDQRGRLYAQKLKKARASRIARTEIATAFNAGHQAKVEAAVQAGLPGEVKKEWLTANDERVCPICGPLEGVLVGLMKDFPRGGLHPPAHPSCRCAVVHVVEGWEP